MLRNRIYYTLKPWMPRALRRVLRRFEARRALRRSGHVWPILESAGTPPKGWPGWPDGKQFAVVLTHDVESQAGVDRVRQLAELEMSLGFRSSFNFIPEGDYRVSAELRHWLTENGFEVGVHDHRHDGKLYRSRDGFRRSAERINGYLREWNAVGFRSGFMLHNLDWLHDLNIAYDASTFDTDPFEPQPDGVGTIFPFWVPAPRSGAGDRKSEMGDGRWEMGRRSEVGGQKSEVGQPSAERGAQGAGRKAQSDADMAQGASSSADLDPSSVLRPPSSVLRPPDSGLRTPDSAVPTAAPLSSLPSPLSSGAPGAPGAPSASGAGYVELPYTLIQDSTLFFLLEEKGPAIWKRKADWVAAKGGMVLLNLHPDYIGFGFAPDTFDAEHYREFLRHLKQQHAGKYWHALPRDVAQFVATHARTFTEAGRSWPEHMHRTSTGPKIWIDLENTPHIPFFKPIIRELQKCGNSVVLTARDAYQTCEMADSYGLDYVKIGRHYGKKRMLKAWGLIARAAQLLPFALRQKPTLALNHGSRTQNLVCNLLGIPTVTIMDYEHSAALAFLRPLWEIVPEVVSADSVHSRRHGGVRKYPGIKEDVYVPEFKPDPAILRQLGLADARLIVTVRPPATEAHYHNPEAEALLERVMDHLGETPGLRTVLLPRNKRQEVEIRTKWPHWFNSGRTIIPSGVVDGLNLVWHSDLVVSGGGTMNREAAALGVPVYSIFRGKIGAVDHQLQADGRLVLIESVQQVAEKIHLKPRDKNPQAQMRPRAALQQIIDHVQEILGRGPVR